MTESTQTGSNTVSMTLYSLPLHVWPYFVLFVLVSTKFVGLTEIYNIQYNKTLGQQFYPADLQIEQKVISGLEI